MPREHILLAQSYRVTNRGSLPVELKNSGSLYIPRESVYSVELCRCITEILLAKMVYW